MKTTIEFLEAVKRKYDLQSNYALAKKLGQTDTGVARWMHGKNTLGDEVAIQVAYLLDLDPAYVVACVHAERAKKPAERQLWERMAVSMAAMAATVVLSLPIVTMTGIETASTPYNDGGSVYIMSNEVFPDA